MRIEQGKPGSHRMSGYRIAALVIAIGGHLALWLLLLRPVGARREPVTKDGSVNSALELRFIYTSRSFRSPQSVRSPHLPKQTALHRVDPPKRQPRPKIAGPGRRSGSHSAGERSVPGRISIRLSDLRGMDGNTGDDGGFMARLHAAQRTDVVHGVPGSDTTYVPGIHLIDPMEQGIGAVMRTTQRAFGITSRHCIDVDVWKHLTPEQLSARHVSPDDVARAEATYHCDAPLGLHF